MQELSRHSYSKNNKAIVCYYLRTRDKKREKVPMCDCLCLSFEEGSDKTKIFLRPDEALIVAKQLIESVYKTTCGYDIKLLKEIK